MTQPPKSPLSDCGRYRKWRRRGSMTSFAIPLQISTTSVISVVTHTHIFLFLLFFCNNDGINKSRQPVNSSHHKIVWRVHRCDWQRCDELTILFDLTFIAFKSFAVIIDFDTQIIKPNCTALHMSCCMLTCRNYPYMLSAVSGCHLTGMQIKKVMTGGFVMCLLVTSWLCVKTCMWRVDHVTSWLVWTLHRQMNRAFCWYEQLMKFGGKSPSCDSRFLSADNIGRFLSIVCHRHNSFLFCRWRNISLVSLLCCALPRPCCFRLSALLPIEPRRLLSDCYLRCLKNPFHICCMSNAGQSS